MKKGRSGDSQECAEIYTGKWMYYKLMLFLKDTVRPRSTEGNISDDNTLQENSEFSEIDEIENDSESDILSFANNPDIEQSLSKPESENDPFIVPTVVPPSLSSGSDVSQNISIKRKKKQPNKEFETELLKLEQQKLAALIQSNTNPVTVDDEDMLFLKSLHPYFHSMNPLEKLQVRNQIQTVLINKLSTQVQQFPPCNEGTSFASSIQSPSQYSSQQIHYQNHSSSSFNF